MNQDFRFALGLLDGGPPLGIQRRLHMLTPESPRTWKRVALVVLLGWVPILLIVAWTGCEGPDCAPWFDFSLLGRSLLAASVFIIAERITSPGLGGVAYQFVASGLIATEQEEQYRSAVLSVLRWRDSRWVEATLILCSYIISVTLAFSLPTMELPAWHRTASGAHSPAGWWHVLVSLPLLLTLLLGWLWRLVLWSGFLWRMALLDLRLLPAHPDRAAGLKFLGYSARAYAPLGFAFGAIVAGTVADQMVYADMSYMTCVRIMVVLVLFVAVLFSAPTLLFLGSLLRAWRRGVFDYGALADRVGFCFERKWVNNPDRDVDAALEMHDFTAADDLNELVSKVYTMRLTPVDLKSLGGLMVATLLPFLPALLFQVPIDKMLWALAKLLF